MGGAYGKLQYWFTFVIKQLWSIEPAEYWVCLPLSTLYKWESSSGPKTFTKLVLFICICENSNVSIHMSLSIATTKNLLVNPWLVFELIIFFWRVHVYKCHQIPLGIQRCFGAWQRLKLSVCDTRYLMATILRKLSDHIWNNINHVAMIFINKPHNGQSLVGKCSLHTASHSFQNSQK